MMIFLHNWGARLLITGLMLCLTACGPQKIPYSQSPDVPEPNAAAIAHYNWGSEYADQGNFGQAIMEFTLAIHNEPGWAMPFFTLGVVYGNQGELDKAIQAWERATHLDTDFAKAHYNLAVAYSLQAHKALSIASLREAIRVNKAALSSAQAEPAFDKIRNTPEYQELLQAAEANP